MRAVWRGRVAPGRRRVSGLTARVVCSTPVLTQGKSGRNTLGSRVTIVCRLDAAPAALLDTSRERRRQRARAGHRELGAPDAAVGALGVGDRRHPANKGGRVAAERRAITWHWATRGSPHDDVEAVVTVDGQTRMVVRPHQFSAVWTIYDGVHEWEELQFCLRFLRPGDHFVDVGANVGIFSTLVGTRIPGVRITAVEPFPPVREDLVANLALNDLTITVVDAAVSDVAGEATFEVLDRDVLNRLAPEGGGGTGITVPVTTLDELVGGDPPALVKIDVEGSELLVMQGARRLLSDPVAAPVLVFEHAGTARTSASRPPRCAPS